MNSQNDSPTVLIVDDDQSVLDLYEVWLTDEHHIRTAKTGTEALDMFGPEIDVVLLDREMPGLKGSEVLARIRDEDVTCRVALVSGVKPDIDIIEMEFDDYVVKPVSRDELVDLVERLIRRSTYTETIQESFRLASRLAVFEAHLSDHELATSEEYADLRYRYETLQTELDTITVEFTEYDYLAEFSKFTAASD